MSDKTEQNYFAANSPATLLKHGGFRSAVLLLGVFLLGATFIAESGSFASGGCTNQSGGAKSCPVSLNGRGTTSDWVFKVTGFRGPGRPNKKLSMINAPEAIGIVFSNGNKVGAHEVKGRFH